MAPLTRETVTSASRIMLPTYVWLAAFIGVIYVFDPQGRVGRTAGLALAREIMPMGAWGACFLVVAGLLGGALIAQRRTWFIFALYLYMWGAIVWAVIYGGATFLSPEASFVAPAWPLFVAVACRASARSLMRGEV